MEYISQGQITRAKRFSGVAQDDKECAQDTVFEPTKLANQPYNTHGYKEIEISVFEYICAWASASTTKTVALKRLCVSTPTLLRTATAPFAISRLSTSTLLPTLTRMTLSNGSGNILRQQQVLLHYRTGTTTVDAIEDAVHRIQACTGPNSALSVEIATWHIMTAATKATGTALTETVKVLSLEALQRENQTFSSQPSP